MNFIEAFKSNKPFRQIGTTEWYVCVYEIESDGTRTPFGLCKYGVKFDDFFQKYPTLAEILNENWEVKD